MPRIAIDVSPLSDGNSTRGVGYYTSNLVAALQSETKTNPEFRDFQIDLITNPRDYVSRTYDLVHYPYFDPFKLSLPFIHTIPFLISIHDLIPIEYSSHFPAGIKGFIKWQIQKLIARQAKYIITISNRSKYIISDILRYPQDRIYTTYLAADSSFKPCYSKETLDKIRQKYNLPKNFVLYLGDLNWNKNVPTLVNACLENKYPLVIVGSAAVKQVPIHPWTADIHWLQQKHLDLGGNKSNKLILTGFVPDEELPYFFNLAKIYCQPSYAEGFGLPLIQAMQSGCPTITSDKGALAEISQYNSQLFNAESKASLKQALNKVWDDVQLQKDLRAIGLKHAKSFTWRNTAIQTLAVYRLALINEKK